MDVCMSVHAWAVIHVGGIHVVERWADVVMWRSDL